MDRITWSDEFSVGNRTLDAQHKTIIGVVNGLIDNPQATVESELLSDALTTLTKYAVEHFREEERLMAMCEYPGIEEHKNKHQDFGQKIAKCCVAATIHVRAVPWELLTYLRDWWTSHILQDDAKYKPFLAERRAT